MGIGKLVCIRKKKDVNEIGRSFLENEQKFHIFHLKMLFLNFAMSCKSALVKETKKIDQIFPLALSLLPPGHRTSPLCPLRACYIFPNTGGGRNCRKIGIVQIALTVFFVFLVSPDFCAMQDFLIKNDIDMSLIELCSWLFVCPKMRHFLCFSLLSKWQDLHKVTQFFG